MSPLMKKLLTGALVATTLSFSLVSTTTPAAAFRGGWGGGGWHGGGWGGGWRGGYWRGGGWGWGAAGLIGGLAVGSALAYPYYYGGGYPCGSYYGPYGYYRCRPYYGYPYYYPY